MPELYYLVAVPLGPCLLHLLAGFCLAAPAALGKRGWYLISYLVLALAEAIQWASGTGRAELKDMILGWTGTGIALILIELSRARTLARISASTRG